MALPGRDERCKASDKNGQCTRHSGHSGLHTPRFGKPWECPEVPPTFGGGPQPDIEGAFNVIALRAENATLRTRIGELERERGKLLAQLTWLSSLKPDEQSYNNGYNAGWSAAHEPARCGHACGNWKDPKFGTPEYNGDERCEVCEEIQRCQKM